MVLDNKIEENSQEYMTTILDMIKLIRNVYFDVYRIFNHYGILSNIEFTTLDPFSFKSLEETGHSLNFLSIENLQVNENIIICTIKTDGISSYILLDKKLVAHYVEYNEVDRYKLIVRYVIGKMTYPKNDIEVSRTLLDFFITEKMIEHYFI